MAVAAVTPWALPTAARAIAPLFVNAAEASHQQLVAKARDERDRLAAALRKAEEPDAVATQYAATSPAPRRRTLSITG
jgi:histidinol-phosphate/aromatic aminotransferase/cobyric acid decarboxylase-like protein